MTIRNVSTDDPDFPRWRRSAAFAINALIGSDYQAHDGDLDALAALTGTNTIYYRSAADTWSPVTMGSGISFVGGALAATGLGGTITTVSGTAPIVSSGGTTPAISITAASGAAAGSMSAADFTKLAGIATGATANTGTVTAVSVTTANGVSGSVATSTTTPAITLTLGAITPTSVAASGAVSGSNLSGTNTGDQTRASLRSSCKAGLSASLTAIDFSAGYTIPWNTEVWDDASWHDNTTNPERMTVPANVDRVEFIVEVRLTGLTAAKVCQLQILKNAGATVVAGYNGYSDGTTLLMALVGADACVAGDYYVAKVTQAGGSVSGTVASAGSVQFVVKAV